MATIYDFTVTTAEEKQQPLADYRGKVLLIVNTASKCGFTPQYAGLESLYRKYADQGFIVLGFPCNQFADQEPGDMAEIRSFCSLTYDISFPLFAKIEVNGSHAAPLYQYLKSAAPGLLGSQAIKWNFTKFLVARDGTVQGRYAPTTRPEQLEETVKELLEREL